jgi:hypothetical protein
VRLLCSSMRVGLPAPRCAPLRCAASHRLRATSPQSLRLRTACPYVCTAVRLSFRTFTSGFTTIDYFLDRASQLPYWHARMILRLRRAFPSVPLLPDLDRDVTAQPLCLDLDPWVDPECRHRRRRRFAAGVRYQQLLGPLVGVKAEELLDVHAGQGRSAAAAAVDGAGGGSTGAGGLCTGHRRRGG